MSSFTRPHPGSVDEVRSALDAYDQAAARWTDAQMMAAELRIRLDQLQDGLRDMEAEVWANGGIGDDLISGTEKQKGECVRALLARHEPYQQARALIYEAKRELAEAEARRDEAEYLMRGARLRAEYATAWTYRAAAAEGRGPERNNR